ncbi:hypothetical protein LLG10_01865 [bacterium]|nr:hypothetical protein [bacterium]
MKHKQWLCYAMIMILFTLLIGCSPSKPYELQVLIDKQPYKTFTLKELKAMPAESFLADGKIESGPSIATLLKYAGVQTYAKIEIMNEAFELVEFSSEQNMNQLILDITNRSNVKLASESIAKQNWMKAITTIAITTHP